MGPSLGYAGALGMIQIPYDQIKSYEDPSGCCEACCGLLVGINKFGCYGKLRGLGMRSTHWNNEKLSLHWNNKEPL